MAFVSLIFIFTSKLSLNPCMKCSKFKVIGHYFKSVFFIHFFLSQRLSAQVKSWAGVIRPLKSGQQKQVISTASSCTKKPRNSSSCAKEMIK